MLSSGESIFCAGQSILASAPWALVAPHRAILQYYRCNTPSRAILLREVSTPFRNVSRDNCAILHKKQTRKTFVTLLLQVSRDMKSIAAGPLSPGPSL